MEYKGEEVWGSANSLFVWGQFRCHRCCRCLSSLFHRRKDFVPYYPYVVPVNKAERKIDDTHPIRTETAFTRSSHDQGKTLQPNLLLQNAVAKHKNSAVAFYLLYNLFNNYSSSPNELWVKYNRDKTTLASKTWFSRHCFGFQSLRFSLLVGYNI